MRYARLPSVALVLFCGWLAAGCVDDQNGVSVVHFLHLDKVSNNCVADPASLLLEASGTLDVGVAAQTGVGYLLSPVVVNNLIVNTATASPVNTVFLTGFDVELHPDPADATLDAALPASLRKFHLPSAGGAIFPSNGVMPMPINEVAVVVEVINADVAKVVQPTLAVGARDPLALTVHLRPVADHSGTVLNGGWVDFPVFVCNECLLSDIGPCPAGGVPAAQVLPVCNPAQNVETCCESNGALLCGSQLPVKM